MDIEAAAAAAAAHRILYKQKGMPIHTASACQ